MLAMVLNLLMLVYAYIMINIEWMEGRENIINALMFCIGKGNSCWMGLLFPITATIPMSTLYIREVKAGYYSCCILRMGRKKYWTEKIIKTFLLGGISLAMPVGIMAVYLCNTLDISASLYDMDNYTTTSFYTNLAENSPLAYLGMTIALIFLCGASFSVFSLGISTLVRNEFLAIIIPSGIQL